MAHSLLASPVVVNSCLHRQRLSVATPSSSTPSFHRPLVVQKPFVRQQRLSYGCSDKRSVSLKAAVDIAITDIEAEPVIKEDGSTAQFPNASGVYAVYDKDEKLQYIGISRRIGLSIATHLQDLPDLTSSVKVAVIPIASKEVLTSAWKEWVTQAVEANGEIPPGNAPGVKTWTTRATRGPKPDIKLTPGKGIQDLTCSVEDLIEQVVKSTKVVAFVKGTRTAPQCGFSYKVLTILNDSGADYEVVNVLDELYNPGVRDAIKNYTQWPTIPQVFVNGEFVGGADILEEMNTSGELKVILANPKEQ